VIHAKIGKFRTNKDVAEECGTLFRPSGDLYNGDLDPFNEIKAVEEAAVMPEADKWMPETFEKYLAAEVLLRYGPRRQVRSAHRMAHQLESCTRTPSWILVSTKCPSLLDRMTGIQRT
jgi:hypothetical protein